MGIHSEQRSVRVIKSCDRESLTVVGIESGTSVSISLLYPGLSPSAHGAFPADIAVNVATLSSCDIAASAAALPCGDIVASPAALCAGDIAFSAAAL